MFIKKAQKTRFWCIQIEKEHIEYLAIAGYKVQTIFFNEKSVLPRFWRAKTYMTAT